MADVRQQKMDNKLIHDPKLGTINKKFEPIFRVFLFLYNAYLAPSEISRPFCRTFMSVILNEIWVRVKGESAEKE